MAAYSIKRNHKVTDKILITANLTLASPLVMGMGEGEWVDKAIMRLPDGRPYIPASAFAGSLKSTVNFFEKEFESKRYEWLWGTERGGRNDDEENGGKAQLKPIYQSHLLIHDLVPNEQDSEKRITRRDGIKIDYKSNTVEKVKKYDYEILEPGLTFPLTMEITLRENFRQTKQKIAATISELECALSHDTFRLGAFTAQGFGKIKLQDYNAYHFEFQKSADAWITFIESGALNDANKIAFEAIDQSTLEYPSFKVEATFRLKSALMIGASGTGNSTADKSSIKSNGQFVIPGKSIRGAIRHRALRILNIWKEQGIGELPADGLDPTRNLFGFVKENSGNDGNAKRGKIRVEETIIKEGEVQFMLQNRIRIDRFTGGVLDGALFNSEPVWTMGNENLILTFTIDKDASKYDKKLLLMLLKDLWTGDLAIGGEKNVGRGVLQGLQATITNNGKEIATFRWKGDGHDAGALKWEKGTANDINDLTNLN